MKSSVIGYPRIGRLRELKFKLEKYFHGEISENEVFAIQKELQLEHWKIQKDNNIDFIPSNDFSFYDNVLDTAYILNIIPERYKKLQLSELDTYFAMARGYQGRSGDVKALAMKKWFNTNYHYIVPEIDDNTEIKLNGRKIFDSYLFAKQNGIETKPTVIGPFTFLKLVKFTGLKNIHDFVDSIAKVYSEIVSKLNSYGAEWIQFEEPYLSKDITSEDIAIFTALYQEILLSKNTTKILLQTYFGDIRDCYNDVVRLDFDGVGLDFISGTQTLKLIESKGFPKNKILFAGVINGRNIWKNNYKNTLEIINRISKYVSEIVIGTSSSLLHVPYTLKNEGALSDEYKIHFAFAEEKLNELNELQQILLSENPNENVYYKNNQKISNSDRKCTDEIVRARVKALSKKDFIRFPEFSKREAVQHKEFDLPLFPTTTIGSFPQTAEIRKCRFGYKKKIISKEQYLDFMKLKIKSCIELQERIGLDVLVHGEFERNDMVEYFGEHLDGFIFTEKAWVQSYGTRCVKPPIIWGDVSRKNPITVLWSVYAQSLTDKPVKGMLTGPVTILNWSFTREDISLKESAYQIALAIKDEVLDLENNGIKIIQIDEAALREKLPLRKSDWNVEYLNWAIPAFRLCHSMVKPETQIHTHMCYSEFKDIIKDIDDMDADVITFEASRSDLTILDTLKDENFKTEVGPGVYDIHSPRVPSSDEIITAVHKMIKKVDANKLWINPDCGLKTRETRETILSLENLVSAAKKLRKEYA